MKMDQAVIARLRRPINQVWDYIAVDAAPMCGDDNAGAIEMSIDANRLADIAGDKEAEDMIRELVAANDYDDVLNFLADNIQLAW